MEPQDRNWHAMEADEALVAQGSSLRGLAEQEADRRLDQAGPNRLPAAARRGLAKLFLRQFASPLIYLLLFAGLLSLVIGDRWDATFIFGVLLANASIGTFQERKADASARALRSLVPHSARLRRGGVTREVPAEDVVPGDIVELESGVMVTADMRLVEAKGLEADESMLTGEAMPVFKQAAPVLDSATPVADRINMVHAGTFIISGRALGLAVRTGVQTELGRIDFAMTQAGGGGTIPLVRRMTILARQIALGATGMIAVLCAVLLLQGQGWREITLLAIALAVAAIPEGLPVAVTVALSTAASRMARRNVIIRALPAVEGLGACTLIASDKTGTLTVNRLTVQQVALPGGRVIARESWRGDGADDGADAGADRGAAAGAAGLAEAAALCNEAQPRASGAAVGDPVDLALLDFAREVKGEGGLERLQAAARLFLVPYEPALQFAAVEAELDGETQTYVKGAPEAIEPMCRADKAAFLPGERLAEAGYRVLALARGKRRRGAGPVREQLVGLELLGFVGLADPLRHGVVEAIARCRAAGIAVAMITGDHPATALAIGRKLGMQVSPDAIATGADIRAIGTDTDALRQMVADKQVFARIAPDQKLAIVRAFRDRGEIVAVTGDGVNDGPALHAANVGVAMGRSGTDVARGAADIVLVDDNFATIVAGVEEGRVVLGNIRKMVLFMLATGVAEILMFLVAVMLALPLPLTAVQLLWLNLVTNGVLDVTLGFGTGDGDELAQPSARRLSRLVDRDALILMLPGAVLMTGLAVWVLQARLAEGMGVSDVRNHVLLMVVTFQLSFLLAARNLKDPFWRWHERENKWMFAGMGLAILLQLAAMTVPGLRNLLGTGPVEPGFLWLCAASALGVLLATEAAKAWLVRQAQRREQPHGHSGGDRAESR